MPGALPTLADGSAAGRLQTVSSPAARRYAAAEAGDMALFEAMLAVVTDPFEARAGLEAYAEPAPKDAAPYKTFCGT